MVNANFLVTWFKSRIRADVWALFVIIIVAPLIRFLPLVSFSPQAASYGGPSYAFVQYVIKTGTILQKGQISNYGNYGFGIYHGTEYPLFGIYQAILNIVLDIPVDSWGYHLILSIMLTLLLVPAILIFKGKRTMLTKANYLMAIALISLGTPTIILYLSGYNAPIGWAFLLFLIYLMSQDSRRSTFLFAIFAIAMGLTYQTSSLVFLIVCVVCLFTRVKGDWKLNYKAFLGIVLWISYSSLVATIQFSGFLDQLLSIFSRNAKPVTLSSYFISSSLQDKFLIGVNIFLVAVGTLYLAALVYRNRQSINQQLFILLRAYFIAVILFGIAVSSGFSVLIVISRMTEYGALLFLVLFTIVSSTKLKIGVSSFRGKSVTVIFVSLIIFTSVFAYFSANSNVNQFVSYPEAAGANWIVSRGNQSTVYTDLRIGGPIIEKLDLKVNAILPYAEGPPIGPALYDLFYSNNTQLLEGYLANLTSQSFTNHSTNLIFISTAWFSSSQPGIQAYTNFYRGPGRSFISTYDQSTFLDKIYDDGAGSVYYLNN